VSLILDVNDEFSTTIALIEHDMGVVMDISDRVPCSTTAADRDGTPIRSQGSAVLDAYLG